MAFKNENTFYLARQKGTEEIVHSQYERALRDLEQNLGKTMLNYIGGQPAGSKGGLFEDRFPEDTSIVSARFPKEHGRRCEARYKSCQIVLQWMAIDRLSYSLRYFRKGRIPPFEEET